MHVVIVESPAKVRTIGRYLGDGYRVMASFGHVRDLPARTGSVRPEAGFEMVYETDARAEQNLAGIARAVKGASHLHLATDPDREGEAISWHILEILKEKKALGKATVVNRVVFGSITSDAVLEAFRHPRALDSSLVNAQQARRALDYLVGFTLSPILWRKLPGARSAGRVQSVALRLVCERENEIETFSSREYWTIHNSFRTGSGVIQAQLHALDGQRLDRFALATADQAAAVAGRLRGLRFRVLSCETKPVRRLPAPPFITSTLQQEASRKLGLSASETMRIAQQLYEGVDTGGETGGLITYMRTDNVRITDEAIGRIRDLVRATYGPEFLPERPRSHKTRARNAQEAHEAIRPTDITLSPGQAAGSLSPLQARLYELVWQRAVASQMADARFERTIVTLGDSEEGAVFRASGSVPVFPGFLRLYEEGRDTAAPEEETDTLLPAVTTGEPATPGEPEPRQHFTTPPPRHTGATLVRRLEELGIGRPSTYASILSTLVERDYVRLERKQFVPSDTGRLVTAFLETFFGRYFAYDFTAALEEELDLVSGNQADWKEVLRKFWTGFSQAGDHPVSLDEAIRILDQQTGPRQAVTGAIDALLSHHFFPPGADGADPRICPACASGRLGLKCGRGGVFVGCSGYPECRYTRPVGESAASATNTEPGVIGRDPGTGLDISLRTGRFGNYLQLGEAADGRDRPQRVSLPPDIPAGELTPELALELLALPRRIGDHPETGKPLMAGVGPYGAYLRHGSRYIRLPSTREALTIGPNRAVALVADAPAPGRRQQATALRTIGAHPGDGEPVLLFDGRYGPYVSHGRINASLPRGTDGESLELEAALALLAQRAERLASGKGGRGSGATRKGTARRPAGKRKQGGS